MMAKYLQREWPIESPLDWVVAITFAISIAAAMTAVVLVFGWALCSFVSQP